MIMKGLLLPLMALLAIEQLLLEPVQAISCEEVKASLSPCLEYLTGGASSPSGPCCGGVSSLKSLSTGDKRAACECLKAAYSSYPGIREELAVSLPKACGVDLGMTISKDVKCSDIS